MLARALCGDSCWWETIALSLFCVEKIQRDKNNRQSDISSTDTHTSAIVSYSGRPTSIACCLAIDLFITAIPCLSMSLSVHLHGQPTRLTGALTVQYDIGQAPGINSCSTCKYCDNPGNSWKLNIVLMSTKYSHHHR